MLYRIEYRIEYFTDIYGHYCLDAALNVTHI